MNWQPTLRGARAEVRPLREDDFEALFAAAADPQIWDQHSDPFRWRRDRFEIFFRGALESQGALVVIDLATQQVIGSSRFYDWQEADRSIVVGYTFLSRVYWGTGLNAELKALMIGHAFQWARRIYFQVSPDNLRSQRALEKLGAVFARTEEVLVAGALSTRKIYRIDAGAR